MIASMRSIPMNEPMNAKMMISSFGGSRGRKVNGGMGRGGWGNEEDGGV
jgi:hypothetical protein